ncbi:MAG: RraA family protein [Erythrobacter sp.]|uniref:RraA family protein n=1 Tax=Erythrobacter sp. TaxID=1042 RepID=UPI002636365A|nr:RraA family protein [Erythrobacter sp.]MDJ0978153.1 RraA family protein [Erythrobacter sp.]
MSLTDQQIARAAAISAATLHEAAGRKGALPSTLKPVAPEMKLCGRAFPAHGPAKDNLWLHRAIYAAQPGDVILFDPQGAHEAGYWGEVMTEAAKARGLAGLVINGGIRDAARLAEIGWPVFSANVCLAGTGKDQQGRGSLGDPLFFGDVLVKRGDLVLGDSDGIVALPSEGIDAALSSSEARDAAEVDQIARLRAGERTLDLFGLGELPS